MAYTMKDMQRQFEALAALKEEFSRLEALENSLRRQVSSFTGGAKTDMAALSPELKKLMTQAQEDASRAGEARRAQAHVAMGGTAGGHRPGAGRRGVVRL